MEGYLGETIIPIEESIFKNYTKEDWILHIIEHWGQYDGGHHKQWALDQIVRVIHNCEIEVKLAKWSNGHSEWRVNIKDEETQEYKDWVDYMLGDTYEPEGTREYSYDVGIAP